MYFNHTIGAELGTLTVFGGGGPKQWITERGEACVLSIQRTISLSSSGYIQRLKLYIRGSGDSHSLTLTLCLARTDTYAIGDLGITYLSLSLVVLPSVEDHTERKDIARQSCRGGLWGWKYI